MGLGSETWFGWGGDLVGLGDLQKRRGDLEKGLRSLELHSIE